MAGEPDLTDLEHSTFVATSSQKIDFLGGERPPNPSPEAVKPTSQARPADSPATLRVENIGPRTPASSRSRGGFGPLSLIVTALMSLLGGGAGAWLYVNYLEPRLHSKPSEPSPTAPATAGESSKATGKVDELAGEIERIRARLDTLPQPVPPPNLQPIKDKLAEIDRLSERVGALTASVEAIPKQIQTNGGQIAKLAERLDAINAQVTRPHLEAPAGERSGLGAAERASSSPREAETPATTASGEGDRGRGPGNLERGITLFKEGQYKEAYDTFLQSLKAAPEDARLWYYGALARGFSTNNWKGEVLHLAQVGYDKERAGTPSKAEIDTAFSGLTTATGKEWLNYYRTHPAESK